MTPRRAAGVFAGLLAATLGVTLVPSVRASDPADPQDTVAGRILHTFDFEERDDGNFEDTPMHFARVTGMGMPHWVRGQLTTDAARSGQHSFRLDLNGGSALYRLSSGVLPVVPGANYRVSGYIQTSALQFARAKLIAYVTDIDGQRLGDTTVRSRPVGQGESATHWTLVDVTVACHDDDAAWLVIELGLLQPGFAGGPDPDQADALERFRQDVKGSAWFDDLVVSRVPTIHVDRSATGALFREGEIVRFWADASDAALDDVDARAAVFDEAGNVVWYGGATARQRLAHTPLTKDRFEFELGTLAPGWYEIDMVVGSLYASNRSMDQASDQAGDRASDGAGITRRRTAFVVTPDAQRDGVDERFTVDAAHLATAAWPELPTLLRGLGVGRAEVAVWGGAGKNDVSTDSDTFDALLAETRRDGVKITATFAGLTPALERLAGGDDWLALLPLIDPQTAGDASAAETWRSDLAFLVSRHAHDVDRWQLGTIRDANAFADDQRQRQVYVGFSEVLQSLVAAPDLAMPWPARMSTESLAGPGGVSANGPAALSLRVPSDLLPEQIPSYVADAGAGSDNLSLYVEGANADWYGREESLTDLAQRIVHTLASGVGRVTVPLPFRRSADGATFEPTEAYLVLRTLATHLKGLHYQGRVPVSRAGRPVDAFLFVDAAGERGVVVAWAQPAIGLSKADEAVELPLNLRPDAMQVSLRGIATPLRQSADQALVGRATVWVPSTPTLIVGVDAPLTRLRQTVRLDNPVIESSFEPHLRTLTLTNTYSTPISGRIHLTAPDGWVVELAGRAINLNPGESLSREVDLKIPYNTDAGEHLIVADIEVSADRETTVARVPIPVHIGLEDVGLRTLARVEGSDLIVEQNVTNYGTVPINYTAFVLVPGKARKEALVINLAAGQSTTKKHRFANMGRLAPGSFLRSGLQEIEGNRILNDRVEW